MRHYALMKTGHLLGWLGCMLWMLNIATAPKAEWIGYTVGIAAVLMLIAGTIIIGVRKHRLGLGIGLSMLSEVFGIGFLIMMLIPEKETHNVT